MVADRIGVFVGIVAFVAVVKGAGVDSEHPNTPQTLKMIIRRMKKLCMSFDCI